MRRHLAATAALALFGFTSPGFAAVSPEMQATFGNTVVQTNADGSTIKTKFKADGTLTQIGTDGKAAPGTWVENGPQLCVTVATKACWEKAPGKKVGDTWTATSPDGKTVTIAIVAGQ